MKVINIREALLQIDRDTDNKYDLTSLYESCKLSEEDKKDLVQMLSGPATPQDIGALINGKCGNCVTTESFMENYPDDLTYDDSYLFADEEDLENGVWIERASKNVMDSDGFTTDYTWYTNKDGKHIFMFGDKDIETPDEDYADWECESEQCAREWFDNYHGFEDDGDDDPLYPDFDVLDEDDKSHKEETCEKCGTTLNDQGECPYCDLGDEDVLKEEFKPEELTQEIFKTVNDFIHNELGYDNDFINDYVFIEITPAELDTTKIEVRAELNYEELTQLGSKLDKVIQAYDSDAYFEPEDAGILVAYVGPEGDEGEIDPEVVEEITDMLTSAQSLEELRDIYTKYIVPNRDNWSKKTLDEIYDVLDEVLDMFYETNGSLNEGIMDNIKKSTKKFNRKVKKNFNNKVKPKLQTLKDKANTKLTSLSVKQNFTGEIENIDDVKSLEQVMLALDKANVTAGDKKRLHKQITQKVQNLKSQGKIAKNIPTPYLNEEFDFYPNEDGTPEYAQYKYDTEHKEPRTFALDKFGTEEDIDDLRNNTDYYVNRYDIKLNFTDSTFTVSGPDSDRFIRDYKLDEAWKVTYVPEVGDRVKIIGNTKPKQVFNDSKNDYIGEEGTITYIGSEYRAMDTIEVELLGGIKEYFSPSAIEPVAKKPTI